MKNSTSKRSSDIPTEQGRLNFFSDPASVDEVRRLLGFSIPLGAVRSQRNCPMWAPVIPFPDPATKRGD